jgi:hypothetical protein
MLQGERRRSGKVVFHPNPTVVCTENLYEASRVKRFFAIKTDRVDVERQLRSLMAYLRSEPKVWSVVRVPSVAWSVSRTRPCNRRFKTIN